METTKYIWFNGKLINWEDAKVHVMAHAFHYGSAVFEGIRAYKTEQGTAIFRLKEHIDRLFYSAKALAMEVPFSNEQVCQANVDLLAANKLEHGYIRPLIYYGYGVMGLNPRNAPVDVMVACWPWGKYLAADMVDLKISKYVRIHPRSVVCDAKVSGHYVNSILAVQELKGTKYHEALLLDYEGNLAEGPGENLFIVKNGDLYTPKLGTILAGITRNTVIDIANRNGIKVIETTLTPEDLFSASEAFYTGTAAEVTPIRTVDDRVIGPGKIGPISELIKKTYNDVVHGRIPEYSNYLTLVK